VYASSLDNGPARIACRLGCPCARWPLAVPSRPPRAYRWRTTRRSPSRPRTARSGAQHHTRSKRFPSTASSTAADNPQSPYFATTRFHSSSLDDTPPATGATVRRRTAGQQYSASQVAIIWQTTAMAWRTVTPRRQQGSAASRTAARVDSKRIISSSERAPGAKERMRCKPQAAIRMGQGLLLDRVVPAARACIAITWGKPASTSSAGTRSTATK
jgi:hypothetical protein